jgi:hypothetical protein
MFRGCLGPIIYNHLLSLGYIGAAYINGLMRMITQNNKKHSRKSPVI